MGVNDGFKWVKGERDFVQNLPEIEGEEGKRVVGEEEKGREIIRGFWESVELEEEELEECRKKQGNRKAAGEDEIGGKVWKEIWKKGKGRKVITGVLKWSLEIGYMRKQFRRALGVVMRKLRKEDYGKPESYRMINLLDIWESNNLGEEREEQYGLGGRAV
ncbi:hypothetical protein C7212DRAFT_314527 [Tuber magnatum]|uniref:Uncharacterized protein n=1 Tax=Tuber magnatum TaxID=42249 RepID=A0A317SSY8_9PEZI|nr:hypothetical protein C7212DRAFT_314527 [Tuber magnatum]